jgi:electron transfer flavoprotein alpha subunit
VKVLGWAELEEGKLSGAAASVLSTGARMASDSGGDFTAFIASTAGEMDSVITAVASYGVRKALVWKGNETDLFNGMAVASALTNAARGTGAEVLLVPDSVAGREIGSRTAQALSAGFVNRLTSVEIRDGSATFVKPNFGGKYRVEGVARALPCVFALPSGMAAPPGTPDRVEVTEVYPDAERLTGVTIVERSAAEKVTVRLEEAGVIVSGGRGLGKPEGFALIREFADAVGGEVGASRAVVDSGWIAYAHQVGQTGKTVKPKLYIACGISGAVQHRAGMQSSDFIIAINKDKSAPIFQIADIGAVGDLYGIIAKVLERIREKGLVPRR